MNECVAVLAVCEAPQGHPHLVLSIKPVFILDFSLFCCSLDLPIALDFFLFCQSMLCFLSYFYLIDASATDQVASAVGTCVQRMPQLKVISISLIKPVPLLRALGDRECPLDHVKVVHQLWVCAILVWVLTGMMMHCLSVRGW